MLHVSEQFHLSSLKSSCSLTQELHTNMNIYTIYKRSVQAQWHKVSCKNCVSCGEPSSEPEQVDKVLRGKRGGARLRVVGCARVIGTLGKEKTTPFRETAERVPGHLSANWVLPLCQTSCLQTKRSPKYFHSCQSRQLRTGLHILGVTVKSGEMKPEKILLTLSSYSLRHHRAEATISYWSLNLEMCRG